MRLYFRSCRVALLSLFIIGLYLTSCRSQIAPVGWNLIETKSSPPVFANGAVAYSTTSSKAILFGGITTDRWLDETWEWDGNDWTKLSPTDHPDAREKHAMAYDGFRDRVVLFGGVMDKTSFGDTWEWDGSNWHLANPIHKPPARCCHAMGYDSVSRKVLLYGGWDHTHNVFFSDIWMWDGTDWTEITCCSLSPMAAHVMVDFPPQNRVISVSAVDFVATWAWDGSNWNDLAINPSPARADGRMAYDSKHKQAIFFGGIQNDKLLNDTWVFEGTKWSELNFPAAPPARYGHVMFYDSKRQSIIMFGGAGSEGALNDTWELNLPQDLSGFVVPTTAQPTP